jgi:hypothetical protein
MLRSMSATFDAVAIPLSRAQSSFTDALIRGREIAINRLAGAGPHTILNPVRASGSVPPADLAGRIKETLDELTFLAMDPAGTKVDYSFLRTSPAYTAYRTECLGHLHDFQPHKLLTTEARRAFWVNLYNALVLDAVITFDVRGSVTEGLLGMLSFFRRAAYAVDGQRMSLEDIEHGILRENRGNPYVPGAHFATADPRRAWSLPLDPRVHFALNCGGISCPPIRSYDAEQLDNQLELAARNFVNATVETYPDLDEVHLSQILRWYARDFGTREELIDFLIAYLPDDTRRDYLASNRGTYRLSYTWYDWRLNGQQ